MNNTYGNMNNTTVAGVCRLASTTSTYTYAAVLLLIAIISTLENAVVIITICKYKALENKNQKYLHVSTFLSEVISTDRGHLFIRNVTVMKI